MTLIGRIQDLCRLKDTNQTTLERDLGFGKGTISKWDNSSPSIDKLQKVADYFNVSTDYLLGRENENYDLDIRKIERARKNMPQAEKNKMMKILEASFEDYFNED